MMIQRRRMLASGTFRFTFTGTYTDERTGGMGVITFTSSGTLTVLSGGAAAALLRGGGGGGGGGGYIDGAYGGGGGGGGGSGYETSATLHLIPGTYTITIGAGGNRGYHEENGSNGGTTSAFGYSANGGIGGEGAAGGQGGDGGAGKNAGANGDQGVGGSYGRGGDGGSPNGGDGGNGEDYRNPGIFWGSAGNGSAGVVTLTF